MTAKTKLRIAIYGRHSTVKQTATSSQDQAASCGPLVAYLGGTVVGTYLDPEISGYRRNRPGLTRLLADVKAGEIDVVVSEALDRIARDAEDLAWLGKKLKFGRVKIVTVGEGEIDEIKLAVAGLLGTLFLSQLRNKTHRGMAAAIAAGRFAGGKSYGYNGGKELDNRGEPVRGLLKIDPAAAGIVVRIYTEFSAGLSAIQIATRLNKEGVPGPRGGEWNASTIRGDPKKLVGILNNPLYGGNLVWNRREWTRDPDSANRERRYRIRDQSEWVEFEVPHLRIVSDELQTAVQRQLNGRKRSGKLDPLQKSNRQRHLLSGLIRCGSCGSNYTISGKDYYRCAGEKERGSCDNVVSVRKLPLERMALSLLERKLLTAEHAQIFVEEFNRETARPRTVVRKPGTDITARLREVNAALANLAENMLAGVISSTLSAMLSKLETEKETLEVQLTNVARPSPIVPMLGFPAILKRFEAKIGRLVEALNDDAVRPEATSIIRSLIESVTIYPDIAGGAEYASVEGRLAGFI